MVAQTAFAPMANGVAMREGAVQFGQNARPPRLLFRCHYLTPFSLH